MVETDIEITKKGYQCLRCGHKWIPRLKRRPRLCPKCKSVNWDVQKELPIEKTS